MTNVNLKGLYQEALDHFPHKLTFAGIAYVEQENHISHEFAFIAGQLNGQPIHAAGSITVKRKTVDDVPTVIAKFALALDSQADLDLDTFYPWLGVLKGTYNVETQMWLLDHVPYEAE